MVTKQFIAPIQGSAAAADNAKSPTNWGVVGVLAKSPYSRPARTDAFIGNARSPSLAEAAEETC